MLVLRALLGLILAMFLPGYTFMRLLYPRKGELGGELDTIYHIVLGIVMSVIFVVFVGFIILWYSSAERPLYNAQNMAIALSALTIAFFIAGWYRGAYPWLGVIHPALERYPPLVLPGRGKIKDQKVLKRINRTANRVAKVRREIDTLEVFVRLGGSIAEKYKGRLEALKKELKELEKKLEEELEAVELL